MTGALVTGAGRGLGRQIARLLASRGHVVHVTDVDPAAAEACAAELGGAAFASDLDVRDPAACRAAAERTAEVAGSLDTWVNNAGVLVTGPAFAQDDDTRRLMLEVNAFGTMNGTLAAIDVMRRQGHGHVVNIISLAGLIAVPGETTYSASKHAALAFSLGTSADLRNARIKGIDISCVCPDGIWTPMLFDKLDDKDAALSFSGKLLTVEQVADAVGSVLDRPRPVLTIPRWRGAQVRLFDMFPRVSNLGSGVVLAVARRQQRGLARKLRAGKLPAHSLPD